MPWYYVENGQQAGPVSETEFEDLVTAGRISPETLVWKEGMENWLPYTQLRPTGVSLSESTPFAPVPGQQDTFGQSGFGSYAATGTGVQCNECGRFFSEDEVIRYGTANVCAACKPGFVQRLKEGGSAFSGAMDYAGFWIRFVAKFLDGIITNVISLILLALFAGIAGGDAMGFAANLMFYIVNFALYVFFHGKFGQTPGKMAMRIKVVRSDGSPIGYGLAAGRFFAELLSGLILGIGYIMAAFDEEKRTLHDRLCDTRVIRL